MKTPPSKKASALAPFFINTPAQRPHTVPNESSYRFTVEVGGGGGPWDAEGAGGGTDVGTGAINQS